ncbi:MAG: intracellular multiplication protein IcmP [Marinobacter sp. T13-3]|nr:MAG: intracellular multiplication protein IcmP [Marinobacter sp. T13-3]
MSANTHGGGASQGASDKHLDSLIFILVSIVTVLLVFWLLWRSQSEVILTGLFYIVGYMSKGLQHVPWVYPDSMSGNFASWAQSLHLADPSRYGWDAAKQLISVISHTFMLLFVPLVLLRVRRIRKTHIINRFKRRFNLEKLVELNSTRYAALASIKGEDLLNTPIHEGPLAIARQPIDFALENHLVVVHKKRVGATVLSAMLGGRGAARKDAPKPITGWTSKKMRWSVEQRRRAMPPPNRCRLDVARTDMILSEQLGGPFSVKALDKFERCLLAILLTANTKGLGPARELALKLALSYQRTNKKGQHAPTIDDRGIGEIINTAIKKPVIRDLLKRHHFKATVFMGLLDASWKKGIFTTPEFLWFKGCNRGLYLALCCHGGDRPFSEALGPWAHFMLERQKGHAVKTPCVEAGTDGLQKMLFDEEWIGSDDGLASEIAERKALEPGNDDQYSPTKGIDLFDPPKPAA